MRNTFLLPVAMAVMGLTAACASTQEAVKQDYEPFPPGYGYPTSWSTIQSWINNGRWSDIRAHGWQMFIGANQPSKADPKLRVYETWYNTPETFAKGPSKPGRLGSAHGKLKAITSVPGVTYPSNAVTNPYPIDQSACSFEGKRFLNNGDYMIADVYFSKEFYGHIRDNNYYDPAVMKALWGGTSGAIKNFPDGTFQTKPMYWPVPKHGFAALPVYPDYNPAPDPQAPHKYVTPINPKVYNGFETWTKGVAVTADVTSQIAFLDMSYQWAGSKGYPPWKRTFKSAPVVGINNFYYVQIDQTAFDKLDKTDKCILNQSSIGIYGRDFAVGDYLITIAMHAMTRENAKGFQSGLVPNAQHPTSVKNTWSLQTFWYAGGKGAKNRYTKDRPAGNGPWQNYAMCQSYDATLPREADGTPHVCSNPYIELAFPEVDRSVSSCLTCHSAGAFPAGSLTTIKPGTGHYDSPHRGSVSMGYYKDLLYTDFSWALPLSTSPHK